MTRHKSFKRLVRTRMEKTGESYTAARASLLAADAKGPEEAVLPFPDEKIRERTGRGWEEWFDLLDESGAADKSHREIAKWLAAQLEIEPLGWNAQAVTLGYERARRGRQVGEREDGFAISASKTVAVDRAALRGLRRGWRARPLAPGRTPARAHRDPAEVGPLRLGRRNDPRPRRLRPEVRGEEHGDLAAPAPRRRRGG